MTGKEKKMDWKAVGVLAALALAGASLFLALYNSPSAVAKRELRELEKQLALEEKQEQKNVEERQAQAKDYFSSEDGDGEATLKELDERYRAEIVELVNNSIAGDFGYGINSEEELASLKFYDIYVTGAFTNKEMNRGYDLVVRYIYSAIFGDEICDCCFTRYYTFSDALNGRFRNFDHYNIESFEEFLDYLRENAGYIEEGLSDVDNDFGEDKRDSYDEKNHMEERVCRFTTTDFEEALAAEEAAS